MNLKNKKLLLKAKLFNGFSYPSRLLILEILKEGSFCVSDLVEKTGLSQPNTSNHLDCLEKCGLIISKRKGKYIFYSIKDKEMLKILVNADHLLKKAANKVSKCENYKPQINEK